LGLFPDIIACRSGEELTESTKNKISQFCHVTPENVIGVPDTSNLYFVPIMLYNQGFSKQLLKSLNLVPPNEEPKIQDWLQIVDKAEELNTRQDSVTIAMVGKYTGLSDSYLSVIKSLQHASFFVDEKVDIEWIESTHLEDAHKEESQEEYVKAWETLKRANGILVPGGFGDRGIDGKIKAAKYSRENKIPYLGICLGLQIAVIEFSRNVLNLERANSEEFKKDIPHPVVVFMPEIDKTQLGGTMRLGKRETFFSNENAVIVKLYKHMLQVTNSVWERHRHRYEVNPDYVQQIQEQGLKFVGQDDTGKRQEIIELDDHPYFVGVQYHPEFKSRPTNPSPPFVGLLLAASGKLENFMKNISESN